MVNESIKNGTRLCYKKNENGYAWVTVTEQKDGKLTYIREGKSVTVPDSVLDSRLFATLQEARDKGLILDQEYEDSARTNTVGELKKLEYLLGEEGIRSGHALDSGLKKSIADYVKEKLIYTAEIARYSIQSNSPKTDERYLIIEDRRKKAEAGRLQETEAEKKRSYAARLKITESIREKIEEKPGNAQPFQGRAKDPGKKLPAAAPSADKFDFGPGRAADTPSPFAELFDEDVETPFDGPDNFVVFEPSAKRLPVNIGKLDASFGETLLKLIEERQMKNSEFYNLANISKQLFYRITTQTDRPPKKNIALGAADSARSLAGMEPKVAMLSFSTKGSAKHDSVTKVQEATRIAKEMAPDLALDGELQLDAALVE